MKRILLPVLLAFSTFQVKAQNNEADLMLPFKIYDTHSGERVSLTDMVATMDKSKFVFFGENHDDSVGHVLELKVLKLLQHTYPSRIALSLEMFETDCQIVLNEYLGGFITQERLINDGRAWKNYSDYSPMVEYAKDEHIPVIAANAPRRYVSLMSKRGKKALDSLSDESRQYLAHLPVDTLPGRYYEKFVETMGGMDNMHSRYMYSSQCLWDATMARSLHTFSRQHTKSIIMHVCGRFHSDEYLGTVAQLQKLYKKGGWLRKRKKANVTTISCFSVPDFDHPDWNQYQQIADFVIVTKATH